MSKQASFSEMVNGTADDYAFIAEHSAQFAKELPGRILDHLSVLKGDTGGFAVDRFTHSVQTATRAHRDGKDEEYVVCALLHDIGKDATKRITPNGWTFHSHEAVGSRMTVDIFSGAS